MLKKKKVSEQISQSNVFLCSEAVVELCLVRRPDKKIFFFFRYLVKIKSRKIENNRFSQRKFPQWCQFGSCSLQQVLLGFQGTICSWTLRDSCQDRWVRFEFCNLGDPTWRKRSESTMKVRALHQHRRLVSLQWQQSVQWLNRNPEGYSRCVCER